MSTKPCRACGDPIDFKNEGGRWVPIDPTTREPHKPTCKAERGRAPEKLRRPAGHHVAAYKVKKHDTCELAFYFEHVAGLPVPPAGEEADIGKLGHSSIEVAVVTRGEQRNFAAPVTVEELHGALDQVVSRERWSSSSLAEARRVLEKAAPKLDLSCTAVDPLGPLVERKFELPIGEGLVAGGTLDLVELVGDRLAIVSDWKCGKNHDPDEHRFAVGLYAAWARLLYPEREVRVLLHWLALDVDPTEFAGRRLEALVGDAKATARALVAKIQARSGDEGAWVAKPGAHCSNCAFTARCEAFQARRRALEAEAAREGVVEPATLEELVAELARLEPLNEAANAVRNRVDKLRRAAKTLAAEVVETRGGKEGRVVGEALVAGRWPIRLKTSPRAGYTVEPTVVQTLEIGQPLALAPAPETPALPASPAAAATPPEPVVSTAGAGAPAERSEEPGPGAAERATDIPPVAAAGSPPAGSSQGVQPSSLPASATTPPSPAPGAGGEAPAAAGRSEALPAPSVPAAAGDGGEFPRVPCTGCEHQIDQDLDRGTDELVLALDAFYEDGPGGEELPFCSRACFADWKAKRPAEAPAAPGSLCCLWSPGTTPHGEGKNRAQVTVAGVTVPMHEDQCTRESEHPIKLEGVAVHYVCDECWAAVRAQLEKAARELAAERAPAAAPPVDELRETPKESAGFGEAALAWPCPVPGCGKRYQNARGLASHKRTHAPKGATA